jgi:FkbM family methyltransferase
MNHKFWPPNGELYEMIRKHFPPGYQGHAIDVGASDGVSINTTFLLEKQHRWTVLSVEANPFYGPLVRANRTFCEECACGREPQESAEFFIHLDNPEAYSALKVAHHPKEHAKPEAKWKKVQVKVRTVDQLLAKWQFPRLDVLCVDVEGTELDVLAGCDMGKWKPKVVVVECWDSAGPVHEYLKSLAYDCVDTSAHNYVFLLRNR